MDETLKQKIQTLLDQHRTMRIATLRPDGWPQVTTVGYANEGFTIYFLCGPDSQKAANLARDDRVSLAIDDDAPQVMEITGLSMGRGPASSTIRRKRRKRWLCCSSDIRSRNRCRDRCPSRRTSVFFV